MTAPGPARPGRFSPLSNQNSVCALRLRLDRRQILMGLATALGGAPALGQAPMPETAPKFDDRVVIDPATRRRIGVRLRLPASETPAPLIVYSPGLGSGLSNGASWCEAWRQAGFVVATMNHPVTGDAVFDGARGSLTSNMAQALSGGQYPARIADAKFVIAQCLGPLGIAARIDRTRIGVAGHSYGAIVATLMAEEMAREKAPLVKAIVAFSPGVISPGSAQRAAVIRMPYFCVTGDHDNFVTFFKGGESRRVGVPLANRLAVYRALPLGAKQLLVLSRADHMTFAGEPLNPAQFSRDVPAGARENAAAWGRLNHATTLFWHRYLMAGPETPRADYIAAVRQGLNGQDKFEAG